MQLPTSSVSASDFVTNETDGASGNMATAGQVDGSYRLSGLRPTYFMGPVEAAADDGQINQPPQTFPASGLSYETYDSKMPGPTI